MFISDFAIKRPIVTVVTMVALVVFGIFALVKTDVDEFPDIANPIVFVGVPYPGASPGQVEREVVDRMEEAIQGLNGIDQITSTSTDGFAQIIVQFKFSRQVDQATQDVRDAISGIRDKLPAEMKEPVLKKFDPDAFPIVSLTLSSNTLRPNDLSILADPGITRQLQGINGVAQVSVVGGVDREIEVDVKPDKLQAAKVSIADVVNALNAQNLAVPVGNINGALNERSIRLHGRLDNPQDFLSLVVAQRGNQLVRLGDVADVSDGAAEQRSLALYNGVEAVGIDITKSKGVSTARVSDDVIAKLKDIEKTLPAGVKLDVVQNAGTRVRASVRNVEDALIEGAILTVLVVFLFLNSWRSTVITGSGATGVGDRRVHRCLGFRFHAQHHVAAGAVAGDRYSYRRRDCGARKYRAAHRDGRRSHDGGSYGDGRDWASRDGDDVLHHVCLRADRLHEWDFGAVVQTVRAHHRVRSARVAVCIVLSRSRCFRPIGPIRRWKRGSIAVGYRARWSGSTTGSTARPTVIRG